MTKLRFEVFSILRVGSQAIKSEQISVNRINKEVENFRRVVERVEGQKVYFEVPLFYSVKVRDGAKPKFVVRSTVS